MRADEQAVARAGDAWRGRLEDMARPLTAVMVGGQTRPFRFDADVGCDLARALTEIVARDGGSIYATTSRRTGSGVVEELGRSLPAGARIYRWGTDPPEDNPYMGLLASADRFVVTGDSISMQVEVAGLGKPLAIFPLPLSRRPDVRLWRAMGGLLAPGRPLGEFLRHRGVTGFVRDIEAFHRQLYQAGLAVPVADAFADPSGAVADEVRTVAARVRRLYEQA